MNVFKDVGTCGFHCHKRHPTEVPPSGARHPSMLPLVFNVPSSFFCKLHPVNREMFKTMNLTSKVELEKKELAEKDKIED